MEKLFFCPALELFRCLPLWKTVLFVSSRAFLLSTPVDNSEATWKKATKCNKGIFYIGKVKAPQASFCIHPSTFDKRSELKGSSVFNRGAILLYKSIFGPDLTTRL